MKRIYIFIISFCLSFSLFGIFFQEKKTVDQLIENIDVECMYTETFNNGKKDFLYTYVETKDKKITIVSEKNGYNASISKVEPM